MKSQIYCVSEIKDGDIGPCKIGVTACANKRLAGLQSGNWRRLHVIWATDILDRHVALEIERSSLIWFRPSRFTNSDYDDIRLRSEWIAAQPSDILSFVRHKMELHSWQE